MLSLLSGYCMLGMCSFLHSAVLPPIFYTAAKEYSKTKGGKAQHIHDVNNHVPILWLEVLIFLLTAKETQFEGLHNWFTGYDTVCFAPRLHAYRLLKYCGIKT